VTSIIVTMLVGYVLDETVHSFYLVIQKGTSLCVTTRR
jgi:hypothetical protein